MKERVFINALDYSVREIFSISSLLDKKHILKFINFALFKNIHRPRPKLSLEQEVTSKGFVLKGLLFWSCAAGDPQLVDFS